jgi:hypothetical protein
MNLTFVLQWRFFKIKLSYSFFDYLHYTKTILLLRSSLIYRGRVQKNLINRSGSKKDGPDGLYRWLKKELNICSGFLPLRNSCGRQCIPYSTNIFLWEKSIHLENIIRMNGGVIVYNDREVRALFFHWTIEQKKYNLSTEFQIT